MSIEPGSIRSTHHVGLPSFARDWPKIRTFWESLGLECREYTVTKDDYDHAGAGLRLQVFAGSQLLISYHDTSLTDPGVEMILENAIDRTLRRTHVAFAMSPLALNAARGHESFERETHWGHSNTSVFLTGPYGIHVELVTTDPDYHRS